MMTMCLRRATAYREEGLLAWLNIEGIFRVKDE